MSTPPKKHGLPNVTIISQTKLTHTETVYNFEVQDFHTYHIGEYGVWVHNTIFILSVDTAD